MRIPPLCSLIVEVMRLDEERKRGAVKMECRRRQQKTRQQKRQLLSGGANYESQTREMATAAHSKVGQWVSRCTGENVFFFFFKIGLDRIRFTQTV
jgi:hypothetical protein